MDVYTTLATVNKISNWPIRIIDTDGHTVSIFWYLIDCGDALRWRIDSSGELRTGCRTFVSPCRRHTQPIGRRVPLVHAEGCPCQLTTRSSNPDFKSHRQGGRSHTPTRRTRVSRALVVVVMSGPPLLMSYGPRPPPAAV